MTTGERSYQAHDWGHLAKWATVGIITPVVRCCMSVRYIGVTLAVSGFTAYWGRDGVNGARAGRIPVIHACGVYANAPCPMTGDGDTVGSSGESKVREFNRS